MKNNLVKDFFREIKKNKGRFLSIFFIVMLGTAFFSGIRAAGPDMKIAADKYYKETKMMDIRLLSTLGLTDEDIESLSELETVKTAKGGKTAEVLVRSGQEDKPIKLIAKTTDINELYLTGGREAENKNECVADPQLLMELGVGIGDTISLKSGTKDPLSDTINVSRLKIVGSANLPYYLDLSRGNGSIGDGSIRGFLIVSDEIFESDIYTEAYILVNGADEFKAYSDEYNDRVKEAEDEIEELSDFAVIRRYDTIIGDAREEIDDAKREIADAKKKLADAEEELADADRQIADGEKELADGEKEIADGEKEISDNEALIAENEALIAENEQKLADGMAELREGEALLAEKEKELSAGWQQLEELEQTYNTGVAGMAMMRSELDAAKEKLEEGKKQLDLMKQGLPYLEAAVLSAGEAYNLAKAAYEADPENEELREQMELAASALAKAQKEYESLAAIITDTEGKLAEGEKELAGQEEFYAKTMADLAILAETIPGVRAQLEEGQLQIEAGRQELAKNKEMIENGYAELEAGKAELSDGRAQLEEGKAELAEGKSELSDGRAELEKNKKELEDAKEEFAEEKEKADKEIADAETDIAKAEADLAELEIPEWYILNRDLISSNASFGQDADRISKLGNVFPVMFFLVAALVSLTAMTRMIEEQRGQIGTLKALGFANKSIAGKYLWYAMLATVVGGVIGVVIGEKLLPYVVQDAYKMLYAGNPYIAVPLNYKEGITAVVISAACTGIATFAACGKKLSTKPAELMRPEAPSSGKRVFMERLSFIWKHMSFSGKATVRNLFRYKKRFFMTIFGVGGCMALMLVGFGIEDSITEVAKNQYVEIFTYEATATLDKNAEEKDRQEFFRMLDENEGVDDYMKVSMNMMTLKNGDTNRDAYLFVPEEPGRVFDYMVFRDRVTKESYPYPEEGVALSEKTADMLGVVVGDTIGIAETENSSPVYIEVTEIVENYVLHYAFISPETYAGLFEKEPDYTTVYMNYEDNSPEKEKKLGNEMLKFDAVSSVSFITDLEQQINDMLGALHYVMYVLIISAALLAFVVLYNLNSVNMTERRRELATLKVLGFYDTEVAMYVYRENIILSLFGLVVGVFLGAFLHRFIITTVEVDLMMFGRIISLKSYIISAALTFIFSMGVNLIMYRHFKKIDMVESLKSVE